MKRKFWVEFRDALCESFLPAWILFVAGVALIITGLLIFNWRTLAIVLISVGAIFAVIIPVRIFLSLIKKYKTKK